VCPALQLDQAFLSSGEVVTIFIEYIHCDIPLQTLLLQILRIHDVQATFLPRVKEKGMGLAR
jgi:hypothetical protein